MQPLKVAIVTGAASGIGWATARRFASAGYRVVVADLDGARALARAETLGPGHAGYAVDIAEPGAAQRMVGRCVAEFGRLDVLVNNAGRTTSGGLGLVDQPQQVFDSIFEVNFEGAMAACNAAASVMAAQGGGSIVNIASGAAFRAIPFRASYSASKAAVVAASEQMAEELAAKGVRVNVIAPGFVRTELLDDLIEQGRLDPAHAISKIPLGRMGTPDDLADAIHFVATQGRFAGAVLNVDGGSQAFGGSGAASATTATRPAITARRHYLVVGEAGAVAPLLAAQQGEGDVTCVASADALNDAFLADLRTRAPLAGVLDMQALGPSGSRDQMGALHALIRKIGPVLLEQGAGSFVTAIPASGDAVSAGREAGLDMLVRTLACEWGPLGVRANSLRVGTNFEAGDVALAARYLLSETSGFVTGAQLDLRRPVREATTC
jgi:NAD(P)-dependent dehydrogenase (short-subunit alcohol dehydrogenase family)